MLYIDYIKIAKIFRSILPVSFDASTPLLRHKNEMFYFRELHEYSIIEYRIVLIYTQFVRDLIHGIDIDIDNDNDDCNNKNKYTYTYAQEYLDKCISFEDFCKLFYSSVITKSKCSEIFHAICSCHNNNNNDNDNPTQNLITYDLFETFLFKLDEKTFNDFMSCFYYSVDGFQQELNM